MAAPIDRDALDSATAHGSLGEDGRSGATLQRATLTDGRRVVVKRYDPASDFVLQVCGDDHGREVDLYLAGVLDDLPPTVRHAILAAWYDDEGRGVVVMRDLGRSVLTWADRVSAAQTRSILARLADLHAAYLGRVEATPTPLDTVVGIFQPDRIRPFAGTPLVDLALRGWTLFAELCPGEVGERVLALAHDVRPLVAALAVRPSTLVHGDVSTVNLAPGRDAMTMIDWGLATVGPGALDVARLLAGCGHLLDLSHDEVLAVQRDVAGAHHDETSLRLALVTGLVFLGWNKALDAAEHPDEAVRAREREGLTWWLGQARLTLEMGVI